MRFYVIRDRTPKMRRLEVAGKRLIDAITETYPQAGGLFEMHKPVWKVGQPLEARIYCARVQIASIRAEIQERHVHEELVAPPNTHCRSTWPALSSPWVFQRNQVETNEYIYIYIVV